MGMKIRPDMTATPPESLTARCVVLDSFQRRRWAPLSGWLTVTQILKPYDCWHCFLRSLTLKGPFQGSAESIFFFIFFLGVCDIYLFFFCPLQLVISLSYLFCERTPDHRLKGTLSEGEQLRSSTERINLLGYSEYVDVCGERGRWWWRMVGGVEVEGGLVTWKLQEAISKMLHKL